MKIQIQEENYVKFYIMELHIRKFMKTYKLSDLFGICADWETPYI